MNLIIDIGNTRAKTAILEKGITRDEKVFETLNASSLEAYIKNFPGIRQAILSSVAKRDKGIIDFLKQRFSRFIELNGNTPVPFVNKYRSKSTLGSDRIAALAGAIVLFPASDILIVDAGTAITFDLINSAHEYLGGNISPGLSMRYQALNQYTGRLPLVHPHEQFAFLGNDTENAIVSGVQNGMIFEIQGYIDQLQKQYESLKIILAGGDAPFFEKKLKNSIFVSSNLLLLGLNRILEYVFSEE